MKAALPEISQPNENRIETPATSIPVVSARPQRNRHPPPRTDFSRSIKGSKYCIVTAKYIVPIAVAEDAMQLFLENYLIDCQQNIKIPN
ncbi:hypothetical protein Bhyg_15107 [Pseudolycoriella hygida]|uniref:Uncharacterized protein n=1 Tax=Pseudolycoriella hygida TaxID=35572 RepID=A0A9Q0MRA1_9DIPT|nr:hypothetical protein Bhyg_15107 [Pseudolycoriella hygida]